MSEAAAANSYRQMRDDPQAWIESGPAILTTAPTASAPSAERAHAHASAAPPPRAVVRGLFNVDWQRYYTKTFASNACTFALMLVGVFMKSFGDAGPYTRWVLAAGVFGFAGGITNWLAVHMLFERVPGLYGSGVIPLRFVEIRETVKDTMMKCGRRASGRGTRARLLRTRAV